MNNMNDTWILPSTMLSLGNYPFNNDNISFNNMICRAITPPSIIGYLIPPSMSSKVLYVPRASINDYVNADFWKLFGTINAIEDL